MTSNRPTGAKENLTLRGREYTVETTEHQGMPYVLTGAHGATYGALRALDVPSVMRLISYKGHELTLDGNAVRLSDEGGVLHEATFARTGIVR